MQREHSHLSANALATDKIITRGPNAGNPRPMFDHILDGLTATKHAVLGLKAIGLDVVRVRIGSRNPRLFIQPSPRCAQLGGTTYIRRRGQTVMVARFMDCQVEWVEAL
jgi:hypothetical protein